MLTLKPAWLTHTCSWIGFHSPAWRVTFMTPDLTKDVVCFCFWVFKGIICASSSHFCTQMHSIFYITWYCNKLHLQKRLWLLWMSSCATLWNCRLLRVRGGVTTFASNLARKFYSNVFFYWETIVVWLCVQVRPKCVWACACMCLYKRRRGCMVCYDSPDGLRLPVPGYDE